MEHISVESVLGLYEDRSTWGRTKFFWILALILGLIGSQALLWGDRSSLLISVVVFTTLAIMFICVLLGTVGMVAYLSERRDFCRCSKIVSESLHHLSIPHIIQKEVEQNLVHSAKQVLLLEKAGFPAQAVMEKEKSFRTLFDAAKALGALSHDVPFDFYFNLAEQKIEEGSNGKGDDKKEVPVSVAEDGAVAPVAGSKEDS